MITETTYNRNLCDRNDLINPERSCLEASRQDLSGFIRSLRSHKLRLYVVSVIIIVLCLSKFFVKSTTPKFGQHFPNLCSFFFLLHTIQGSTNEPRRTHD